MPLTETDRLRVLRSYAVLDTPPDPALDRITALARLIFDAPMAILSLVDRDRQWLKSRQGPLSCEIDREHAFCAHTLFGRFEQADASTTRRFGGSGLGLAISRAIVEGMSGELRARSTPGRGSTFEAVLVAPAAAVPATPSGPAPDAGGSPLEGRAVLLAEDVALNRDLIGLLLGRCGVRLTCVENGAEAVEAAAREPFDAVLMDMQMPVLDGVEAARRIRASGGPNAGTPIVALTANVLPSEVAACRAAGMDGHLAKPFTAESLAGALQAVLTAGAGTPPARLRARG